MGLDADQFDFFVSYARKDNENGWITAFVKKLLEEHRSFSGGRDLKPFFDHESIRSFDDWEHRIYEALSNSRMFLAFLSPNYLASDWCRREWRSWIDIEIAKHILTHGAEAIYLVEIPGLVESGQSDAQMGKAVAELGGLEPRGFVPNHAGLVRQFRRRQLSPVQPFFQEGLEALQKNDILKTLRQLAQDLDQGVERIRRASESETTLPPYNRCFSGRLEELLALRKRLLKAPPGGMVGIHGLGGVGKTELAYTYAHAFAGDYPGGRFHVPCDYKASLREAIFCLGDFFRDRISDEERNDPSSYLAAILRCLRLRIQQVGPLLLVLDNVECLTLVSQQETDFLTTLGQGLHLLATSRLAPPASSNWLTLGALPESDALELLDKHRSLHTEQDLEAGRNLVRELDGFPLAVELVAAWLKANEDVAIPDLLTRFRWEGITTLEDLAGDEIELRRHNHERRLGVILQQTLIGLTPEQRLAMEYAAILPANQVAITWLKNLVGEIFPSILQTPQPGHKHPWEKVVKGLMGLTLLSRPKDPGIDAGVVTAHRMVQAHLRQGLSETDLARREQSVEDLIHKRIHAINGTERWLESRWELGPLEALAYRWDEANHSMTGLLMNETALWLEKVAEFERAEPLMRRTLAITEADFGPDHPEVAIRLSNLAQLLKGTNRPIEAEPLIWRALQIWEANNGPDHPTVAIGLSNLARLLQDTNRLADAEPLMRRALTIVEISNGPNDPTVAEAQSNLALLLKETNRLTDAEPLMRHALRIWEVSYGPDHPTVATGLSNLARLLRDSNRPLEAEPMLWRALLIDEASFGPCHPSVATDLNYLAMHLQAMNRLAEAEPLMWRALRIWEASFGLDHPTLASGLNNLSGLLQNMGRPAEAEPLIRRALAIMEASLGPNHPTLANGLNNLAMLLKDTNRLVEAEPLILRALAIDEASYGPYHPNVARDLSNLAIQLRVRNRLEDAEPLMRRALGIWENSNGPNHPSVATGLNNLALLLQDMNRYPEAEPLIRRALEIDEASFGPDHPKVATRLNNLASWLRAMNRLSEAEPLMRRTITIMESSYGAIHPAVATCLRNLALLLQDMNRPTEAEPLMQRARSIRANLVSAPV